jgi:hypothetical protein
MVGVAPGRINLSQLHSHTGGILHSGVSELMASCVCRFLGSAAFSFLDGVVEAEVAIPSGVSILLLCPCYYGVGFDVMVSTRRCLFVYVQISFPDTVVVGGVRSRVRGHVASV